MYTYENRIFQKNFNGILPNWYLGHLPAMTSLLHTIKRYLNIFNLFLYTQNISRLFKKPIIVDFVQSHPMSSTHFIISFIYCSLSLFSFIDPYIPLKDFSCPSTIHSFSYVTNLRIRTMHHSENNHQKFSRSVYHENEIILIQKIIRYAQMSK